MGKGMLLLVAGLVALGLLYPGTSVDVAQLMPVEVLVATMDNGQVKLSGGGLVGYGETWEMAMMDFQSHGQAFFGTTGHVVAEKSLVDDVLEEPLFRPAARLYRWVVPLEEEKLPSYLKAHPGNVTIAMVQRRQMTTIPVILEEKGGLTIG